MKNKLTKRVIITCGVGIGLVVALLISCNVMVVMNAKGRTYDKVEDVPAHEYGLLLATSPFTPGGARNYYYENRIKAAAELYKAQKIKKIIASGGDYRTTQKNGYDEPSAIRDSLRAQGVPAERIILDYEGTRTFNSIAKIKRNDINSFVIISQKDHNERTLSIANHLGFEDKDVVAYNAKPSRIRRNRIKNTLREYFARVKMYIDFWTLTPPETQLYEIPRSL